MSAGVSLATSYLSVCPILYVSKKAAEICSQSSKTSETTSRQRHGFDLNNNDINKCRGARPKEKLEKTTF